MSSEEVELLSDSKYRQFIAAVEKALRSFESTSEWADLISALGKLNKVLLSYSKFVIIPRKLMIGKRLSQCMHPALPSGVHLKALETYTLIFERIGKKRLSQDLFIYSAGLFPLMSHAAMSVKPLLMKLYEEHFIPLGEALIPSLPGLLLALLPGIEEGSDYTERTISLLESFSSCTDKDIFFDALWQSMITTPTVRLPATIFLLSQLDKHLSPTEQKHLLGKNHAFMVQGVCVTLNDKLALVQRNLLDFLVQFLPLDSSFLPQHDLSAIMTAALGVLLRRDMSLNRRLYAWILGTNGEGSSGLSRTDSINEDDMAQYFETHSKTLVVKGLRNLFRQYTGISVDVLATKKGSKLEILKPFRILLNLLDKPEIGSAILEDILIDVFKNLFESWKHFGRDSKDQERDLRPSGRHTVGSLNKQVSVKDNVMEELIKTANLLFNTFEPYFMWQYVAKLLAQCNESSRARDKDTGSDATRSKSAPADFVEDGLVEKENGQIQGDGRLEMIDVIRLTDFILNIVALEASVETESKHWPELLAQIIQELTKGCQNLTLEELEEGILLCSKLLSKVTPSTNVVLDSGTLPSSPGSLTSPGLDSPGDAFSDTLGTHPVDKSGDLGTRSNRRPRSLRETGDEMSRDGVYADNPRDNESHGSGGSREKSDSHRMEGRKRNARADGIVIAGDVGSPTGIGDQFQMPKFEEKSEDKDGKRKVNGQNDSTAERKVQGKEVVDNKDSVKRSKRVKEKEDVEKTGDAKGKKDGRKKSETRERGENGVSTETKDSLKEKKTSKKEKRKDRPKDKGKKDENAGKYKKEKVDRGKSRTSSSGDPTVSEDSVFTDTVEDNMGPLRIKNVEPDSEHVSQSALIRYCIKHFQTFLLEFFRCKVLNPKKAKDFLEDDQLRKIKVPAQGSQDHGVTGSSVTADEENVSSKPAKTYSATCKLLVELSCFPMQNKGTECVSPDQAKEGKPSLPSWLRCLIACCCEVDDFNIQSTSVATLLDLINLTLSVSPDHPGGKAGVTVIPILTFQEVVLIEQSDIYQIIANNLWSILGRPVTIHHRKAVELLIQLHNLTPSPHLCENVIGSSMVSDCKESRLEALKRFANLWHIAKSILAQSVGRTARGLRTFDRSLFVMLDGLESEQPETRSLTKMWVSHSLEQGDIGRILEPLLLLLLHPSTARVSQYFCEREKAKLAGFSQKTGESKDTARNGEDEMENDGEKILDEEYENEESKEIESGLSLESSGSVNTSSTPAENPDPSTRGNQDAPNYSRLSDIHKLHYSGKCDYQRILYAFRTLSSVLRVVPRQFVCAAAATSIGSSFGPYEERIRELLIRHKRSLLGKGFYGPLYGGPTASSSETTTSVKSTIKPNTSKYLEILITIALYFIRSHYPPNSNMDSEFVEGNIKTQVVSLECLSNLTWELVKLVRESGHGFGNFITDLLARCKVQKAIVHCLAATTMPNETDGDTSRKDHGDSRASGDTSRSSVASRGSSAESVDHMILQSKLLEVVESLIVLENALLSCLEALTPDHLGNSDFEIIMKGGEETSSAGPPRMESRGTRFVQGKSLSSQDMLLNMVLYSLKAQGNFDMRSRWTDFIIECLPYLGVDLKKWVVPVALQMCCNLSDVANLFNERNMTNGAKDETWSPPLNKQFPPDHLLAVLAGLTSICHFCLLEAVSSPVLVVQPRGGSAVGIAAGQSGDSGQKNARSMQIFANLLHAFSSNSKTNDSPSREENSTPLLEAREGLLSILPRIISTLLSLWGTWNLDEQSDSLPSSMALLGTAKALRQSILQLLTPIAMTHTIVFVASIADVWNTSKRKTEKDLETGSKLNGYLGVSEEQLRVITLVLDIKALSLEVVIDTVRQILHQELTNRDKGFEASLLQFFHEFLLRSPVSHITQAKSSFLALLKDGLQLNLPPSAVFLLIVNLHSYYLKTPGKDDRKTRKESQDIAQRLIEACTAIAGLSLGSSAWFSRNLSVISVPDPTAQEISPEVEGVPENGEVKSESNNKPAAGGTSSTTSKHSTQALVVLADILASLLDMVFGREEKERVVNFLINVMEKVTPYLRNHSHANVPSFRACCSLVASLSGYQYTRKAWRKETFDLFFEQCFFQMDKECVGNWRTIIDNLFTQDQASFRDLMARATVTPSAAISFFGNHEQEMQQRALMVKRLSFAVFSSEPDQYQSFLPEMQERLAECLRMPQVPVLHEQVFLFFRVLLLRMSDNMTSIWPMIISEMIHVFLLMESDLLQSDTPSRDQQMFYSETVLGASGYVNYSQEKWLGLYLSVCKLLDMALCLPPEQLPQFQMYRWAFEGSTNATQDGDNGTSLGSMFIPYVSRITKLLAKRKNVYVTNTTLECHAGRPLLTMPQLDSVDELLPFLRLLSTDCRIILDMRSDKKRKAPETKGSSSRDFIEKLIERDFIEPLKE